MGMKYRRIFADGYSYYLTMVTHQRKPLLVEHIDLLRYAFASSKKRYDYRIDAIVVLPDHLHMIITPQLATDYPKIIAHIKRSFLYGLDKNIKAQAKMELSSSKHRRDHAGIWQERYYEHTIRNEKDLIEKLSYMRSNPVKHNLVERADEWQYSSFYKS
jgi:putative transposase